MRKSSTPITIGSKTVKNRITFAPTVKFGWSDNSGIANPRLPATMRKGGRRHRPYSSRGNLYLP